MGSLPVEVPLADRRINIVNRFIDDTRSLRVAVIGGGLSGITAGILLPEKVPGIQLTIYEKNGGFGGTWLENIFPRVRCDIPSHVYQSTFAPKTDWSDQFSFGAEIRDYWQGLARRYGVDKLTQFNTRVQTAEWDGNAGIWRLSLQDVPSGTTRTTEADVLVTAIGRFNDWQLPEYPGIHEYKGLLRHTSNWDSSFDPDGKRVAIIGNGASGIQVVPALQRTVAHLDHYVRNRTWIASSWAGDERTYDAQPIPADLVRSFDNPETYLLFRKELEAKYWRRFANFLRGSDENGQLRDSFIEIMRQRVAKKPELLADLVPDFSPNCRRLTPGPGYLEALTEDNVDYIRTPIRRFTATGIETEDGVQRDVDAIFCATGANISMVPTFSIRGVGGRDLRDVWGAVDQADEYSKTPAGTIPSPKRYGFPYTYLGTSTPGFPNLFFLQGPHASGASGTVPQSVETQVAYIASVLRKLSREGIKSIQPSERAADDFVVFSTSFFDSTVLSDNCSSWYNGGKPGGYIHGLWPGSAGHLTLARRNPRWEDWEYEYVDTSGNRFAWYFGNGQTRKEADPDSDVVSYLKLPGEVSLRDLHESWWDLP